MGTLQDIAKQTYKLFLDEPFCRPLRSLTVKHPHAKRSALFAQTGYSLWRQPRVRPEEGSVKALLAKGVNSAHPNILRSTTQKPNAGPGAGWKGARSCRDWERM